jgi:hypothetical protein
MTALFLGGVEVPCSNKSKGGDEVPSPISISKLQPTVGVTPLLQPAAGVAPLHQPAAEVTPLLPHCSGVAPLLPPCSMPGRREWRADGGQGHALLDGGGGVG